jgi:hypothetical protein
MRRAANDGVRCFLASWACLVCFGSTAGQSDAQAQILNGIDRAQEMRERCLEGYSVTEHYTIHNSHFEHIAEMTVRMTYRKGTGKSYQIVSRTGPSLLRNRVFDSLLRAESEMSRGSARENSLITTRNYRMRLLGTETIEANNCYVIELEPIHRSSHVLRGRAWFRIGDFGLVRIEGRPAASPSFWIGRPQVTRDYQLVDGFWLACKSHARSDGLFAGHTDLTIEYTDYEVSSVSPRASGMDPM